MAGEAIKKSILQMAHGAIEERVDIEMARIIENILNENTKPETKRKLTLELAFEPNEDRSMVTVSAVAKAALAPLRSVATALYVDRDSDGKPIAVEAKADIPGQTSIFEEGRPVELKVVNN